MSRRHDDLVNCALCGRKLPESLITQHHLLPRQKGGGPEHTAPFCGPCHGHVHATYDNHTLAVVLNTLQALRADPNIAKFIRFIRKQDAGAAFRSKVARTRRGR